MEEPGVLLLAEVGARVAEGGSGTAVGGASEPSTAKVAFARKLNSRKRQIPCEFCFRGDGSHRGRRVVLQVPITLGVVVVVAELEVVAMLTLAVGEVV